MKFEYFIAKRLISGSRYRFSKPTIRLIIFSIALGVSTVILTVSVVRAYKAALSGLMAGFAGHIQVVSYDVNQSFDASPVEKNAEYEQALSLLPDIVSVSPVAYKTGILKAGDEVEGVTLKGVEIPAYPFDFLAEHLVAGKLPAVSKNKKSNEILLSKIISRNLHLNVRDTVRMYFFDKKNKMARGRRFIVSGIFQTHLEQFDRRFAIGDIRHVQKLNHWDSLQISAYEIKAADFDRLEKLEQEVLRLTPYEYDVRRIDEVYPALFQWLSLHDKNVEVIIALILMIASITMIALLLILVLEKIPFTGILKALGCRNSCIRKIFIYQSIFIVGQGLVIGNLFSYALIFLQSKYHFISLNPEAYYLSYVPMQATWADFLLINAGALLLGLTVLLVPSLVVAKIRPLQAIRFR